MIYRIYTEDKNRNKLEKIVATYFHGFTLIPSTGYWEGAKEESLIIEVVGINEDTKIRQCAEAIKAVNEQQAVLVTCTPVECYTI